MKAGRPKKISDNALKKEGAGSRATIYRRKKKLKEEAAAALYLPGFPKKPIFTAAEKIASKHWDDTVMIMCEANILSKLDVDILFIYCKCYQYYKILSAYLDAAPLIKNEWGDIEPNKAFALLDKITARLVQLSDRLSLSPAKRTKPIAVPIKSTRPTLKDRREEKRNNKNG